MIYRTEEGIDTRYRAYTPVAENDLTYWIDAVKDKVDPARETADKDTNVEVLVLIMYNKILMSLRQDVAKPSENIDEEDIEDEDAKEEKQDDEEEEIRDVAVERRPLEERQRAFTILNYSNGKYELKIPDDVGIRQREPLETFLFKYLRLSNPKVDLVSIKGSFAIKDIAIIPELFLHLISTDQRLYPILYINELQKAYPEKDRVTLHYESSPGKSVTLSFSKLHYAKLTDVFRKNGKIIGYNGDRYFYVKLSKATDYVTAEEARDTVLRAFQIYLDNEERLIDLYAEVFPDIPRFKPPKIKTTKKKVLTAFEEAKLIAPNVFRGQGRALQRKNQVQIVTTDRLLNPTEDDFEIDPEGTKRRKLEAENDLKEALERRNSGIDFDVLLFKGVYYKSLDPQKPHVGFKESNSTKDKRVPSCYKTIKGNKRVFIDEGLYGEAMKVKRKLNLEIQRQENLHLH